MTVSVQCISHDISVYTGSVLTVYITWYFWKYRKCSDSEDHVIFLCVLKCSDSVYHVVFLEVQEVFRQ